MEWTSDQYIGTGGRSLDFISTNMPGTIEIQGEAVAILIRAARNEVIESQLFIRIRSSITNASVQCQDVGTGMTASIEFRLAGMCTTCCHSYVLFHKRRKILGVGGGGWNV